nr:unnamed protein product [Spirometra erinaceieuropaei]
MAAYASVDAITDGSLSPLLQYIIVLEQRSCMVQHAISGAASLQPQDATHLDQLVDEVSSVTAEEEERELHEDEVLVPARISLRPVVRGVIRAVQRHGPRLVRGARRAIAAGARKAGEVGRKVWAGAKRAGRAVWRQVSIPLEWPKKKDKKKRR